MSLRIAHHAALDLCGSGYISVICELDGSVLYSEDFRGGSESRHAIRGGDAS